MRTLTTITRISGIIAMVAALGFRGGCSDDGGGGAPTPLTWGPCPEDYLTECATAELPLDWANPRGETIEVLAARTLAAGGESRAQVWLLAGGPGVSGNSFTPYIGLLQGLLPDVDFYVLEHRGVGASTRLGCPAEEAEGSEGGTAISPGEWPACLAAAMETWGDALAHFTATADARDLARFIKLTREPGKDVYLFGPSYGSYRALRFLQLYPDAVDAVVLDSVVSPGAQLESDFDRQFDPVAQDIAALCAADPVCGEKMGPDPWARMVSLDAKLDAGHCAALGPALGAYRSMASSFLMDLRLRPHLFPIVYRIDRCAEEDVQVVGHYFTRLAQMFQGMSAGPLRYSPVLQYHITLSELWEEPSPPLAELQAACASAVICPGVSVGLGALHDAWPRYPRDAYAGGWPATSVPLLAMNGLLDPNTPFEKARLIEDHLRGPGQTAVAVPYSPHGVATSSPVLTPGAPPCGLQMMTGFLADPTAPVDTSCLDDLVPIQFTDSPEAVLDLFGTGDMWENQP